MAALVDLIVDELVAAITTDCQTKIPTDDLTRAGLVQGGKFQDSAEQYKVVVEVHQGDPADAEWHDIRVKATQQETPFGGEVWLADEIGGGTLMLRRFTVEITCFYVADGLDRSTARQNASAVRSRVEQSIRSATTFSGLSDDYGECIWTCAVQSSQMREGGGPPDQFIWRGKVRVEYQTHLTLEV